MSSMVERVARAIEAARCPGREGPYGLYDYSSYGRQNPHVVRDFRDNTRGPTVFCSSSREAAEAEYKRLTREHIGLAAIREMREPTGPMASAGHAQLETGGASDAWRAMIDEALKGDLR